MSTSNNSSSCEDSEAIAEHGLVQGTLILGTILSPIGIALNVLLLFALKRATAFHINVRIQIGNISLSSAMFCVCFVARTIHMEALWGCSLRLDTRTCILSEAPYALCSGGLVASICAVGIERAIATRRHASYEASSHRLAYLMAALCWINGPFVVLFLLVMGMGDESHTMPVCVIIFASNKSTVAAIFVVEIILSVAILVEYVVLIRVNERKLFDYCSNRALLKLTSRLQLRHNLQLAEMLLPSVVIHTSIMTGSTCVGFWLLYEDEDDYSPVDYGVYFTLNVILVVYTIVHPLICLWRCETLRREVPLLNRALRRGRGDQPDDFARLDNSERNHPAVASSNEMDAHFMLLDSMWERGK